MFGEKKIPSKESLEREVLETLVLQTLQEQKRKRRWNIFFKCLISILLICILVGIFWPKKFHINENPNASHVAYVSVNGIIMDGLDTNSDNIIAGLTDALNNENSVAVVLEINSPGGSPVQSDEVYQAIRSLQANYPNKPIYAVCTDVCASGGYYIASAAKEIYVNPMSIVGSIGVRADGFGFVETLNKLGITRRLFTAGENKDFLDPFKPLNSKQVTYMDQLLKQTHEVFIQAVKQGRGDRLDISKSDLIFSGAPFGGADGKAYGLVDGFMSLRQLALSKYKTENIVDYTYYPNQLKRLFMSMSSDFYYQVLGSSRVNLRF
ncbi:S49 family peptidase [Thiotrichales bacterium 19S9-12]|nr:S49 family peptidase [Thiotrichales bacterium 19S9-11]MCF6811657.1 S49 family peptidase [Thiotrichales bacterium 19S9-12]